MSMVRTIARANVTYYKSRNILTGIAIFLTTVLLFLVPTIGLDVVQVQREAITRIYPTWHAILPRRSVEEIEKLSAHHLVSEYGLREDMGEVVSGKYEITMLYLDEKAAEMYKIELEEGHLPELYNEIVVTKDMLQGMGMEKKVGDTVSLQYQVFRDGKLDYVQEKEFVISGLLHEDRSEQEKTSFICLISHQMVLQEVPKGQLKYNFLFRIDDTRIKNVDECKEDILLLGKQFGIEEKQIVISEDYLWANYVDPSMLPITLFILLTVICVGIITIYSIYYASQTERIQQMGRLKAMGATEKQIRQIVFGEGLLVSGIAIPAGLLLSTLLVRPVFLMMLSFYQVENKLIEGIRQLIVEKEVSLILPWMYLLTLVVAMVTVLLALLRPMRTAARISEIDAIRGQFEKKKGKAKRKGYSTVSVTRLAIIHITDHKRKSLVTIFSMAGTGVLFMVIATILLSANPTEAADASMMGEYRIVPVVEEDNREHPELAWSEVQRDNPINSQLIEQLLSVEGIDGYDAYDCQIAKVEELEQNNEGILGVPEEGKEILLSHIVKGAVTYEELKSGDKVIIDKNLLLWYPNIDVGSTLHLTVKTSDQTIERCVQVMAIADYDLGFTRYHYLVMAKVGLQTFGNANSTKYVNLYAKEKYNAEVEAVLSEIVKENGRIRMETWKSYYDEWKSGMTIMNVACNVVLGILGMICVMNMINTMIHSVQIRKKELGMLQAVGMSDLQLLWMLQSEGVFYTIGTFVVSVGLGSIIGYPAFQYAKSHGMLNITKYHYPMNAALLLLLILVVIQLLLSILVAKSAKKESIINRIRFDN